MLPINWNTALKYAQFVQLAYEIPVNGNAACIQAKLSAIGYTLLDTLYADQLATDLDPHLGEIVSFGFLAVSPTCELVAAIRGTETIMDWMHDASFLMVPVPIKGMHGFTEDGFTAVYRSLRTAPDKSSPCAVSVINNYLSNGRATSVTICGHSLGGALATLLTADVALNTPCRTPVSYTYASPRVGDHSFAGAYNAIAGTTYRIDNRQDLVPKLPPIIPLPYEHVNTKYELVPPQNGICSSILCMHILSTYMWLISKQAGVTPGPLDASCVPTTTTRSSAWGPPALKAPQPAAPGAACPTPQP